MSGSFKNSNGLCILASFRSLAIVSRGKLPKLSKSSSPARIFHEPTTPKQYSMLWFRMCLWRLLAKPSFDSCKRAKGMYKPISLRKDISDWLKKWFRLLIWCDWERCIFSVSVCPLNGICQLFLNVFFIHHVH